MLVLAHHQDPSIATHADARLRRLDLAAADPLPGLDVVDQWFASRAPDAQQRYVTH
jgi:hypothetical protein